MPADAEADAQHMLAEIGHDGLSILYYSPNPMHVRGWMNFPFEKNLATSLKGAALSDLLEREALPAFTTCHIFFNFKETMLVPQEFFKEPIASSMLDCIHGPQPTDAVFSEQVPGIEAVNVYRVDDFIYNSLNSRFLSAVFYHSNTLLLPYLLKKQVELFVTIYQDSIRVILFREDRLQLAQYFEYNTPSDVAYHLLNVCQQHAISPAEIRLLLSGFIQSDSNLYDELYRYFLNIELEETAEPVTMGEEVQQMPAHFYSHLISLAKCVS